MSQRSRFKTLVVVDLETTGFIQDEPKITELAMIAVNIEALERTKPEDELPRVLHKFVKCFDPLKLLDSEVAKITGECEASSMLMDYAPFNYETVIAIEAFLSDFQQPISHNGDLYDFPILSHEIQTAMSNCDRSPIGNAQLNYQSTSIPTDDPSSLLTKDVSVQTISSKDDHNQMSFLSISCADSLAFFRHLSQLETENQVNSPENSIMIPTESGMSVDTSDKSSTYIPTPDPERNKPSLKLSKIYQRDFPSGTSHLKHHQAEHDCLMLLAILKRHLSLWLQWIEVNHRPLNYFSSSLLSTIQSSPKKIYL
ncbi:unnamed protein product [Adineta ricciae]|uniref:Exonuclease domain-containing protein n=1 Tax=Adineta ricciae TaxID=249248 RepID=A0A814BEI1_ADIRI|nr:unnamed protein product [Adineta ricciae]